MVLLGANSLNLFCNIAAERCCAFTTLVRTFIATSKVARFFFVGEMRNVAILLLLQQCCKTSYTFFVARFTRGPLEERLPLDFSVAVNKRL